MNDTRAASDLEFYRVLRQLDWRQPDIREALAFARIYADLARRLLGARLAQGGEEAAWPPMLALPALRFFLGDGTGGADFRRAIPPGWDGVPLGLLGDLAEWLAEGFAASDPLASSYQVWLSQDGGRELRITGQNRQKAPPGGIVLLRRPPVRDWLASQAGRPVALIAHYDVHGISMLALTLRYVRSLGIERTDCALGFEWSGDISKLWKRAVPRTITHEAGYSTVVLLDCSVHSRRPEYTLKAVAKLDDEPDCRLVIVDHHEDTFHLAPSLLHERAWIVLADVLTCGLVEGRGPVESELIGLGAIGDKLPEIVAAYGDEDYRRLQDAADEFHRRAIHFSPTPAKLKEQEIYPLEPLWQALAGGRPVSAALANEALGPLEHAEPPPLPSWMQAGSIIAATQRLGKIGRNWYALLERIMDKAGAPYAVAMRILDGKRANILLLTKWQSVQMPPVRHFIPEEYLHRCLGHPSAVWADLEIGQALPYIEAVAGRINKFLATPADFAAVGRALQKNIIDADIDHVQ